MTKTTIQIELTVNHQIETTILHVNAPGDMQANELKERIKDAMNEMSSGDVYNARKLCEILNQKYKFHAQILTPDMTVSDAE